MAQAAAPDPGALLDALDGLLLLGELLDQPPLAQAVRLLDALARGDRQTARRAWGGWFRPVQQAGGDWPAQLWALLECQPSSGSQVALAAPVPPEDLLHQLEEELLLWRQLALLPQWGEKLHCRPPQPLDPAADPAVPMAAAELWRHWHEQGAGPLCRHQAFVWDGSALRPVAGQRWRSIDSLQGLEEQWRRLCTNVEALLARRPALDVLLHGARGTGKSSLIKALLPAYGRRGLRLVQLPMPALETLPELLTHLSTAPQSFVLFIDDLGFEADDTRFKLIKAVLEGGLVQRPDNIVLAATSNRRHLVPRSSRERPGPELDDLTAWDGEQEKLSFADRFGLVIRFAPYGQAEYLTVVSHLAHQAGLAMETPELRRFALQWALHGNGFSGRTARHCVDHLTAGAPLQSGRAATGS